MSHISIGIFFAYFFYQFVFSKFDEQTMLQIYHGLEKLVYIFICIREVCVDCASGCSLISCCWGGLAYSRALEMSDWQVTEWPEASFHQPALLPLSRPCSWSSRLYLLSAMIRSRFWLRCSWTGCWMDRCSQHSCCDSLNILCWCGWRPQRDWSC